MGKRDKRVDAYIVKSADFAIPVLEHLRELVHKACPEVEETIKWGFPNFDYKGIMCGMASFKKHCSFGFWKTAIMKDPSDIFNREPNQGMGSIGKIASLEELPSDKILIAYIKEAARLNDEGVKNPVRSKPKEKKELTIPDYFLKALKKDKKAKATFDGFSYTNKKEYLDWITEAKTEDTRNKRIDTALEWMAEGKIRNWKYLKK